MLKRFLNTLKNRYGWLKTLYIYTIAVILGIYPLVAFSTSTELGALLITSTLFLLGALAFKERLGESYQFVKDAMTINITLLSIGILLGSSVTPLTPLLCGIGMLVKPTVALFMSISAVHIILILSKFNKA
jgi:hypothetical protein